VLEDLTGLGAVRSVAGAVTLQSNAGLSQDEIAAFLRQIGR
jgi:hypothetical protein